MCHGSRLIVSWQEEFDSLKEEKDKIEDRSPPVQLMRAKARKVKLSGRPEAGAGEAPCRAAKAQGACR